MNRVLFLLVMLFAGVLLISCGGNANAEPEPPHIHYGEDLCEFCGMIISEERFAAGYITADGQEHIFDDIGDMVQSHLESQQKITANFVHDHETHTWIRAETAYYVLSEELPTPMLSGLAAFESAAAAETFAGQFSGQRLSFDELLTYYRENPPTPIFSAPDAD